MIRLKPHLEELIRKSPKDDNRCEFLRLDMNEDPVGLPNDFIEKVLSQITPEYLSAYPEYANLLMKIAAHNNISVDNICLSNGSDSAIKYIFDAYISPDDKVLLTDPTFAMYPVYTKMAGAKTIMFPYEDDLSFSVDGFLHLIDDSVKMAVLVNPNNPIGSALPEKDIKRIIEKCYEFSVCVVVDEAYYYFYNQSMVPYIDEYDNLIVLRTFSKACGLANLRIGYAVSNRDIISNLNRVRPSFDINGVAVLVAETLLESGTVVDEKIEEISKGKQYIVSKLKEGNYSCVAGEGNFILIHCPNRVSEVVTELRQNKILVSGGFQQQALKDYIRVTVGSFEVMDRFWSVFSKITNGSEDNQT